MPRLTLALLTLTACMYADLEPTQQPTVTGGGVETATGRPDAESRTGASLSPEHDGPSPGLGPPGQEAPPTLLPYGIGPTDPYSEDPNANRACAWAAERVATWHQRKGIEAYCKKRSWFARRGAKEPKRWVDGSYLHAIDIPAALKMWRRALKAGWINPDQCPAHGKNYAVQMFSRGKWFDLSLYNARHLVTTNTIPCWDPAIMDRTDVGALTVAARSAKACFKHYRSKCTEEHLRVWWKEWIP